MNGETDPCYTGSTCTDGVCKVSEETEGKTCKSGETAQVKMCDVGQYCETATGPNQFTCQKVIAVGEACTIDQECGFMGFCDTSGATSVCALQGSLAGGVSIGAVDSWNKCASGQALNTAAEGAAETYICVKASVSKTDPVGNAVASGSDCAYTSYTYPAGTETATDGTTPALCGFNTGTNGYCPVHRGDSIWADKWTTWTTAINNASPNTACNGASAGATNGQVYCSALAEKIPDYSEWPLKYMQLNFLISGLNAYPNVADNSACVKTMITAGYWGSNAMTLAGSFVSLFVAAIIF